MREVWEREGSAARFEKAVRVKASLTRGAQGPT